MDPRETVTPAAARRIIMERMLRGEGAAPGQASGVPATIQPRDPARSVPLTAEQSQLWLHAALAPEMPLYNESITLHRHGPYNHEAVSAALSEIVRRHAIWRTVFVDEGGEPVAKIAEPAPVDLPLTDLTHLPEAQRDAAAVKLATGDARRLLRLDTAPLFNARAVKMADDYTRIYLTLHHIIFDGVAIYGTLVPELSALVAAYEAGKPSPLPEPALQYADYAVWQADNTSEAEHTRQIDYWRGILAEPIPRLEMVGDRPPPLAPTHAGSMECFTLEASLIDKLREIARAEGATLYMVLLAAYKTLLFRYAGETDIIVGGVTDTRRRPELQPLIGYFLNTMALRSRPAGETPFRDYLAQVKLSVLGALGASDVPFNRLIRALDIKRGAGTHPVFNTLFSIEPPVAPFPDGWDLTQMDVTVGAAKYDLYLELDERHETHGGGMVGRMLYSTELFDPATIRRMIGNWQRLVEGIAADPQTPLARLPMLGAGELTLLRDTLNDTAQPLAHDTMAQWFAKTAARLPDATALVQDDVRWSYADLCAHADAIAARLQAEGVAPGDLVGLSVSRTPWMVAAMLAVARVGAAYLPLDPGFPPARLAMIAEDAAPKLVLVEHETAPVLASINAPLLLLARDWPAAPYTAVAAAGDDLAYVLFTSGSTGRPKGVEISHTALVNLLGAMKAEPGFAEGESLLAITTLSFDIAELELWLPLVCGGTVHIAPREISIDMAALADTLDKLRPDVMQATPATWRGLIEAGWEGAPGMRALCGGEAFPRVLAEQLLTRVDELWNVYGPTETTIWSTVARVSPGHGPVPIGHPIANTRVRVLDADGNDRPVGAVGELWIGGLGLARGYRGRPDLTAERFVTINGERLYRTGDLARWRSDNQLICLGRVDTEEKIRGFRIAIEEVEGALVKLPGVAAAAVRAWPDASGERALAGYAVASEGAVLDTAEMRELLAQALPDYMIPSRLLVLDALPMTPNGKIDRNALPEPGVAPRRAGEPPHGEAEEKLAAIWCDVLKIEAVSRNDDFFDLGGHSLLIARLLRQVEKLFGTRMPMATLFRAPVLADMAEMIASGKEIDSPALVPIQPKGSKTPILWLDGGSTMLPLTQELGDDQPFIGISVDALLEALRKKPKRLDDIAALVVAEIRRIRPEGPYRLGGWCSSGIVAYAVAAQMAAQGADIELLILAHAFHPVVARRIGSVRFFCSKFAFHFRQTMLQPKGKRARYFAERLRGLSDSAGLAGGREAVLRPELRTAIDKAALRYVPPLYPLPVLLFEPADHPAVLEFSDDWGAGVSGDFEAHVVPGGHRTMLEPPNVENVARIIEGMLERLGLERQGLARQAAE